MSESNFWQAKKVLVGGGCGFLGSYLVPQLVASGAQVTVVDNLDNGDIENLSSVHDQIDFLQLDLRDPQVCDQVTRDKEIVINLAAKAFGMDYSRIHNGEILTYNLLCSLTLLEAARRNDIGHFMVISSSCVYPDEAPVPTPELDVFTGKPESVNEGYGWAKRIYELAGTYYANEFGMNVSIVRPFNPYGANYRWRSEDKAHVIPALVKRVMQGEDPLRVWGSGRQRRNFLHARDATGIMMILVEKGINALPVNIGYEEDITIADLVNLICEIAGKHPHIEFDTTKPEGRFAKSADASRLRQLTENYTPQIGLRQGIQEMIDWYKRSFS